MGLELKKFLEKNKIPFSFYNNSTKETRSYNYEVRTMVGTYWIVEGENDFCISNIKGVPKMIINFNDLTIDEFTNALATAKRQMTHTIKCDNPVFIKFDSSDTQPQTVRQRYFSDSRIRTCNTEL